MQIDRRSFIAAAISLPVATRVRVTGAQSSAWTLLDDAGGPAGRWDHVLLADGEDDRLYLFGGRDGDGVALSDLWRFDLGSETWERIEPPGPSARFGSAAAITPDGHGFVLFGGQSDVFFNDLWSFDFESETWSLLDDGSTVAPSARYGLGGAFDATGRFVISHGFTFDGRFDDTWAFSSGSGWLDISPSPDTRPLRRCLHELLAVDGDHLLLFAGCSSGYGPCPQGDLWLFSTTNDQWAQLTPDPAPAARSNPALSISEVAVLLVGGLTESGPAADVWSGTFDGSSFTWSFDADASDIVPARSSHDMTAIGETRYLFGGLGGGGVLSDLWRYTPLA